MFERPLYQASIVENIRPGHAIINVVFNGTMASYELIPQDNACWKDFHVNRKSGLVTNKVRIYPCYTVFISIMLGTFNTKLLKTEKKNVTYSCYFSSGSWRGKLFDYLSDQTKLWKFEWNPLNCFVSFWRRLWWQVHFNGFFGRENEKCGV